MQSMLYVALWRSFGPVEETGHARGRVLFVRLDGVEVDVMGWWLSEDFLET